MVTKITDLPKRPRHPGRMIRDLAREEHAAMEEALRGAMNEEPQCSMVRFVLMSMVVILVAGFIGWVWVWVWWWVLQ